MADINPMMIRLSGTAFSSAGSVVSGKVASEIVTSGTETGLSELNPDKHENNGQFYNNRR